MVLANYNLYPLYILQHIDWSLFRGKIVVSGFKGLQRTRKNATERISIENQVRGERPPDEVYADFLAAFHRIRRTAQPRSAASAKRPMSTGSYRLQQQANDIDEDNEEQAQIDELQPPIIWIVGGPGSSKSSKMEALMASFPGWKLISCGPILWSLLEERSGHDDEVAKTLERLMRRGDFVPHELLVDLVIKAILSEARSAKGFFVAGFPRDLSQARLFEQRASFIPTIFYRVCQKRR